MAAAGIKAVPDWDLEQLEIIMDDRAAWQLVTAGPGSGKSAVACQRVAFLIDEGVSPSRILLISFTRTAIAELRDRIVSFSVAGERARSVRISTLDSHAWSLRVGFDDVPIEKFTTNNSYELNIARAITLFRERQPDLLEFVDGLEHIIIDEAQDVIGLRAEFVVQLLKNVGPDCGVTVLADPAQAIYDFTEDEDADDSDRYALLDILAEDKPRKFARRHLSKIHRVQNPVLVDVFMRTRCEVESPSADEHLSRVAKTIRESSGNDLGDRSFEDLAEYVAGISDGSTLVLFRHRFEVLMESSYCSTAGLAHRLRLSGMPVIVRPWIGWLFSQCTQTFVSEEMFNELWKQRSMVSSAPLEGENQERCWATLLRLAAAKRPGSIDVTQLRALIARPRPPVEICLPECGFEGPILGTIHASKGREADNVVLVLPEADAKSWNGARLPDSVEEGRVYYVGATRARKMLAVAARTSRPFGYLESKRVYRRLPRNKVQLEIGRDGDVDRIAHLAWTDAEEAQRALANSCARTQPLQVRSIPELDYAHRLTLGTKREDGVTRFVNVGELSHSFEKDLGRLWSEVDASKKLRPPLSIPHVYLCGASTVALREDEISAAVAPYNRSGFGLMPVIKGFSLLMFQLRRKAAI